MVPYALRRYSDQSSVDKDKFGWLKETWDDNRNKEFVEANERELTELLREILSQDG
jgi:hypothetical protein